MMKEIDAIVLEDNNNYAVLDQIDNYVYLVNVDNISDFCIRKRSLTRQNTLLFLVDESEFDRALVLFKNKNENIILDVN